MPEIRKKIWHVYCAGRETPGQASRIIGEILPDYVIPMDARTNNVSKPFLAGF